MRSYIILETENQELKKKIRELEDELHFVRQSVGILELDNKKLKENLDGFITSQYTIKWRK